jgi:adenylate cyclase
VKALINSAHARDFLVALLLSAVSLFLILPARQSVFVQDAERWGFDSLVTKIHPRFSSNVVIVDFDEEAQTALKVDQVPRTALADVLRKISGGKPAAIGLDFLLTERRSPEGDEAFARAIQEAGTVVVASQFGSAQMPEASPLPEFCVADKSAIPYCESGAALAVGLINLPVDEDGFIRRSFVLPPAGTTGLPFPVVLSSLKLQSALKPGRHGYFQLGTHELPFDESGANTVRIGAWEATEEMKISALKVLDPKFDASTMQDKIVLIGQSSAAAADRHFTPIFRQRMPDGARRMISGTEVHAAAIDSLLSGNVIRTISTKTAWGLWFLFSAFLLWSMLHMRLEFAVSIAILIMGCIYGVALLLFNQHLWLPFVSGELVAGVAVPIGLGYRFLEEKLLKSKAEAERKQLMSIFSRYVSDEVANEIWLRRDEIVIAGQEKTATVLFSDIRGFTKLTAGKDSALVLRWLNEYFTAMAKIVREEKGFLNKFIGDGLMAVFGIPVNDTPEKDAIRAVSAALRMLQDVEKLNLAHANDPLWLKLKIAIGVHTGVLTAGNVGSEDRLEYSVIGETVNLASRLEALTKDFKTEIILSESTRNLIQGHFITKQLGEIVVRGFEDSGVPTRVYSVYAHSAAPPKEDSSSQ